MSKKSNRKPVSKTPKRNTAAPRAALTPPPPVVTPAAHANIQPQVNAQIEHLRDPAAENAVEAAERLAALGDARAVAPLVAALKNADGYYHVVVRAAAAMALGKLGTPAGIDALLAGIGDAFAEVSSESILALGELKAAASVPALLEIVRNPSGYYLPVTRHAAIRALGRLGAAAALPVLKEVAQRPAEDASLVVAAREAIAQF